MTTRKSTEARRREIADAAIKIIGECGLRELTAARIAHEVGIKDGTIFRHYKDMREIVLAAVDRLEEVTEPARQSSTDPLERLRGFVTGRVRAVADQPGIQSLIFSDHLSHALGAEGQQRVAALRNRGRGLIRSCLREAVEQGLVREGIDIEGAVLLISGMVMSLLFAAKDMALPVPVADMETRCWQTIVSVLEPNQVTP